ncbi:MAG: hypothetical protein ACK5NF_03400 [Bacilli bacterium]
MKKIFSICFITMTVICLSLNIYASESVKNDDSLNEIANNLGDEIVTTTNDLFEDTFGRQITNDDIVWENTSKIYVGTNIFEIDSNNINEMITQLDTDGYIYEIPIYINDDTIIVSIAKGLPVDDSITFTADELSEVLDNEGKWIINDVKHYENQRLDISNEIESQALGLNTEPILVGGLPYFRYPVALITNESEDIEILVPLSYAPGSEKISKFSTKQNFGMDAYNYDEIKNYINSLPVSSDLTSDGGYGFEEANTSNFDNYNLIVISIVLACGISVLLIYKKAKRGDL